MHELDLTDRAALEVHAQSAETAIFAGRRALRLENGLVLARNVSLSEASLTVDIAAEGPAYPGLVFRAADERNMELAYAVPHASGLWDAIQYDPVFNGSNTWQIFNGPRYQKQADVPLGQWFSLRVDVIGPRAAVAVSAAGASGASQPPLVVSRLAHDRANGRIGVWTFRPAYFADFRVGPADPGRLAATSQAPFLPPGTISEWLLLDGRGPLRVEENGTLNFNRYFDQASVSEAVVTREFVSLRQGPAVISFGFSDELELYVDKQLVFSGANTFTAIDQSRRSRGYVEVSGGSVIIQAAPGRHVISACVKATEGFGWGLNLSLAGDGIELLPIVG